jgi:hypothetical protein
MKKCCRNAWISSCLLAVFVSVCSAQLEHQGNVLDATTKHIVIPGDLSDAKLAVAKRDPRVMMQLQRRRSSLDGLSVAARDGAGVNSPAIDFLALAPDIAVQGANPPSINGQNPKEDWSVNLGAGNIAPQQGPAVFTLNFNDPNCVSDFVVFALNVAGVTGGQANVVGINQLYSGTDPTGYCGAVPNVNWAYNGSTAGGAVLTSPEISLDGTKVVYIESASGSSILHILTWKAGQGTKATDAASPTLVNPVGGCTATSSCLASVTYSTTSTTTLGSVWVDYSTADKGYVVSDDGKIYRISCVFHCPLNANPTVDWVFALPVAGTGGALPVPAIPVYDGSTYLFVTDQLGEVWSINVSGANPVLTAGPVMIGGGGCTTANPPGRTGTPHPCQSNGGSYGIPDGTLIALDGTDDEIFVASGNDGVQGGSAVVAQLSYDLTVQALDSVGIGSIGNTTTNVDLHLAQFDYVFNYGNPAQGHLFLCGTGTTNTTATQPWDYWIGFANYPVMDSTPTQAPSANIATNGAPCTALTEYYNPNLDLGGNPNDHDLLVGGVINSTNGVLILDDISNGSILPPADGGDDPLDFAFYPGGVSDIVMDNIAPPTGYPQASSMYFSTLGVVTEGSCLNARCAVKLSQLDLQ